MCKLGELKIGLSKYLVIIKMGSFIVFCCIYSDINW